MRNTRNEYLFNIFLINMDKNTTSYKVGVCSDIDLLRSGSKCLVFVFAMIFSAVTWHHFVFIRIHRNGRAFTHVKRNHWRIRMW